MDDIEKPRLARLTAILTQLQSKRMLTATTIAEKHGVSIRTVYRDIKTLINSGVPIQTEEGRGYSLMEGYQVPPVMFTEGEANALITAEKLINKNNDKSLVVNYQNAILKIKSVLKYNQKEKADLLEKRIVFRTNETVDGTSNYLMTIQSAITTYQITVIEYRSLEGKLTNRTVEPFALYSTKANWLLIAFCQLRDEFRVFRLDRIQALSVTIDNFEPHPLTLEEYFEICRQKNLSSN